MTFVHLLKYLPITIHRNEYGMSTTVIQALTLRESNKINDRIFNYSE